MQQPGCGALLTMKPCSDLPKSFVAPVFAASAMIVNTGRVLRVPLFVSVKFTGDVCLFSWLSVVRVFSCHRGSATRTGILKICGASVRWCFMHRAATRQLTGAAWPSETTR